MISNKIAAIPIGQIRGQGPLGLQGIDAVNAPDIFNKVISSTIGLLTIIAIIWFTFTLITGAISIITGGGDKASLENAKKKITNGPIGLVITLTAVLIIDLVGFLFGIEFLQVASWIPALAP